MATGFEAAGIALALFPIVLELVRMYLSSIQTISELIRHKRTINTFKRELDMEKSIFENTWYTLRNRAGVLVEPNVGSPKICEAVLSCLPPCAVNSFLSGCQELATIMEELKKRLESYTRDVVGLITFIAQLYN